MIEQPDHTFKNLLIVMTDRHIGNLLVSLYAIKSAHQQLKPGQTLSCVIDYNLLPLAHYLLPTIDFIGCSIRGGTLSPFKKLQLFIRMFLKLRCRKIDTAVDLYGHGESSAITRLSGATFISAFYCSPKLQSKYHWTHTDSTLTPTHQVDHYLYPFMPVLGPLANTGLRAPRLETVVDTVKQKLARLGQHHNKPLVIIHPGAGKDYKLWPIKHWQALIAMLEERGQVKVIACIEDRAIL